ncbi:unnamed protein product [Protopolystoma xenopodis]|uniref:Uncharacterized protein n=1 Tax=Protopolystoma xenopodis TaxID=117903 RepID=A0A3S5AWL9_9PLAT|nr:unnamed protein product [Protopolystoma xenopodis]
MVKRLQRVRRISTTRRQLSPARLTGMQTLSRASSDRIGGNLICPKSIDRTEVANSAKRQILRPDIDDWGSSIKTGRMLPSTDRPEMSQ